MTGVLLNAQIFRLQNPAMSNTQPGRRTRCIITWINPAPGFSLTQLNFTFCQAFYHSDLHSDLRIVSTSVFFKTITHNIDDNGTKRECYMIGRNARHLNKWLENKINENFTSGVEPENLNKQENTWEKLRLPKDPSWGWWTLAHVFVSACP